MSQKQDLIRMVQSYISRQIEDLKKSNKDIYDKAKITARTDLFQKLGLTDWFSTYKQLEADEKYFEKKLEEIRLKQRQHNDNLYAPLSEYLKSMGNGYTYYFQSNPMGKVDDVVERDLPGYVRRFNPAVADEVERLEKLMREADLTISLATTPRKTMEAIESLMSQFGVKPDDVVSELSK